MLRIVSIEPYNRLKIARLLRLWGMSHRTARAMVADLMDGYQIEVSFAAASPADMAAQLEAVGATVVVERGN